MAVADYLSIFTHGLDDLNGHSPNITSLTTLGYFEPDTEVESYEEWSAMPGQYFQEETIDYDREKRLFSLLATEAINLHGVPMIYYAVSLNTSRDKVFKEDNRRNIVRNFNVQAYYELPNEEEIWGSFHGIEGIDNFHLEISMRHFEQASQYNPEGNRIIYPSYRPKEGDYLKARYNDYFYEVVTVKQQKGQFHKAQHIWDLVVRPMRNESLSVSAIIPQDDYVRQINAAADVFDTSASIDIEKEMGLYDPPSTESPRDPLFGNW